jgi:exopolysaccharide/PEP-CTERM locus tyrosine autokinase
VSLVEKALKKIQAGNRTPPRSALAEQIVVGKVVAVEPSLLPPQPQEVRWPARSARVVSVDRDALRAAGLLPAQEQEREIADQYRAIKRPLIRAAFEPAERDPRRQIIMLASALPGDGKTFTCVNLALSMAQEKDHGVLLVDGDVAKPHVSRVFGVQDEPGLLELLADPSLDPESVILSTSIPKLSILPAGRPTSNATELLASARTRQIMQHLPGLNHRGLVVVDSSPILLTSEARVLSGLAGQIVLVIRANQTPQQAVKDAIEVIGADRKPQLVLNEADLSGPTGYYYGYRYGYAQAAAEGQAPADPSQAAAP